MVLNLFQVTNNTAKGIKTNNVNNSHDNIVISARSEGRHDAWLGDSQRPLEICWEGSGHLIIKFWDDNWKLKYATGSGDEGSIPVDGNKDFYVIINGVKAAICCENGKFHHNGNKAYEVDHTKF
jgi:hypothetical protein